MQIRRVAPLNVAALLLGLGAVAPVPFLFVAGFIPLLVATYIAAAPGFLAALYIDRLQRAEDETVDPRSGRDTRIARGD